MAPENSMRTASSLQRYRPAIFALTALALGCTLYSIYGLPFTNNSPKPNSLRRRPHARRRRQRTRQTDSTEDASQEPDGLGNTRDSPSGVRPLRESEEREDDRTEAHSDLSWGPENVEEEESKDGQSLLTLLYRIAEEQNRKDGYVHRGVQCNSCNESPIRGIRYRCVNCTDYDLCEQCEAMQIHPKTHLFYKIRIPAPYIGAHKERQPVLYPGKPKAVVQDLRKEKLDRYCRETGLKVEEIEAMWEQFRCMAAADWPGDPDHYHLAIDRATFDKCFVPTASSRQLPPSLIYDRIFSYYDSNNDGLIGFEEFVKGLASLKRKNFDEHLKRIFKGYDLDGDGFIDRRDMLRMFNSYYTLTRELTAEVVAGMQDDTDEGDAREIISGGQPISSAFTGSIPPADSSRTGQGKERDTLGDDVIIDSGGAVHKEQAQPAFDVNELAAENADRIVYNGRQQRASGKEIWEVAFASDFPTIRSELSSLGCKVPNDVIDDESQYRRQLQVKLAADFMRRRIARRGAIMSRRHRQCFMADVEEKPQGPLDNMSERNGTPSDYIVPTPMSNNLAILEAVHHLDDELISELDQLIEKLHWPLEEDPEWLRDAILDLIRDGWKEESLAHDLDGYSPDPSIVSKFVQDVRATLHRSASKVRKEHDFSEVLREAKFPDRSVSPSHETSEERVKDVHDDQDSRSAASSSLAECSVNDQWVGFEALEPEADVGREVVYQVTQEALNELLDPMFRLREDLALLAISSLESRKRSRSRIIATCSDDKRLLMVNDYLEGYQRRWREGEGGIIQAPSDPLICGEADSFRQFVIDMELEFEDTLTGVSCPHCTEQGKRGSTPTDHHKTSCDHDTLGKTTALGGRRRLSQERPSQGEHCPRCAKEGRTNFIKQDFCEQCGQPATAKIKLLTRLREIISRAVGSKSLDDTVQSSKRPEQVVPIEALEGGAAHRSDQEMAPMTPPIETSQETTADARDGTSAPVTDDDEIYPEMAIDLHGAITAFNEADVSAVEAGIASQPLEDLLAESGYSAVVASDMPEPSRASDPSGDADPVSNKAYPVASTPDPTLPQNRPDLPDQSPLTPTSPTTRDANPDRSSIAKDTDSDTDTMERSDYIPGQGKPTDPVCRFFATLDILEAEDKERGGPGRLNYEEFEQIMKGKKGGALSFLASWVEVGGF